MNGESNGSRIGERPSTAVTVVFTELCVSQLLEISTALTSYDSVGFFLGISGPRLITLQSAVLTRSDVPPDDLRASSNLVVSELGEWRSSERGGQQLAWLDIAGWFVCTRRNDAAQVVSQPDIHNALFLRSSAAAVGIRSTADGELSFHCFSTIRDVNGAEADKLYGSAIVPAGAKLERIKLPLRKAVADRTYSVAYRVTRSLDREGRCGEWKERVRGIQELPTWMMGLFACIMSALIAIDGTGKISDDEIVYGGRR